MGGGGRWAVQEYLLIINFAKLNHDNFVLLARAGGVREPRRHYAEDETSKTSKKNENEAYRAHRLNQNNSDLQV